MPRFSLEEMRDAYENFKRVSDACAASGDYNAFADLFTDDCLYIEHAFGEMRGRDAVRKWIVPLMRDPINAEMVKYTHDWFYLDEDNGRVIFCARTHMSDPGDGSELSATNWTRIDYAGNGLWSREEDIYNPANFGTLLTDWQNAKSAAAPASVPRGD